MHCVQAQCIDVKLDLPVEGILDKKSANLVAVLSVKVESLSPRGFIGIREVRAELRQIISFRTEMVIDHVEDYSQTVQMAGVYQAFKPHRPTVGVLHGE